MVPEINYPPSIERLQPHREKLKALAQTGIKDRDLVGMTIKGSFALDIADEFSDLDLSFVVDDEARHDPLTRLREFARVPAAPVAAFTAEHVGVPGLLIVLYDDLVHVDLRHVALSEFPHPEEDLPCRVLWERDSLLTERLAGVPAPQPRVDVEWLEARMWTWVWYTQTKILRGEVYEALDILQYLRSRVLFPLLAVARGQRTSGSRRAEQLVGDLQQDFEETVAGPTRSATMKALAKTVDLYLRLADPMLEEESIEKAEEARHVALAALRQGLEFKS